MHGNLEIIGWFYKSMISTNKFLHQNTAARLFSRIDDLYGITISRYFNDAIITFTAAIDDKADLIASCCFRNDILSVF